MSAPTYPLWHPMTSLPAYLEDPVTIVGGEGSTVVDDRGRRFLSATGGLWNVACGYGRPEIAAAIRAQLDDLAYGTLFRFGNEPALRLAARLTERLPAGLDHVFLTSSGASAVDTALRIARRTARLRGEPGRTLIASLKDGYHGTSGLALDVTGEDLDHAEYGVERKDVMLLPTPNALAPVGEPTPEEALDALEALFATRGGEVAALIFEPILGSAGVVDLPDAYVRRARELTREHGALLVVDEVATGFGRTGRLFACEHWDLRPDLLTMSKQINSGYLPLGATAVSHEVFSLWWDRGASLFHGETQAGNPLACAAALATLDVLDADDLPGRAARAGDGLRARLEGLAADLPLVAGVQGRGLMLGVHLTRDPATRARILPEDMLGVVRLFADEGVLVHPAPTGFGLFPPLVITDEECDRLADVAGTVLGSTVPA